MREEEIIKISAALMSVEITFIDKEDGNRKGLIFYRYEDFGKWYADNYDNIEVLEVVQFD